MPLANSLEARAFGAQVSLVDGLITACPAQVARAPDALGTSGFSKPSVRVMGTAAAVTDAEMMRAARTLAGREGLFVAPEGGACVAAVGKLRQAGFLGAAR